MRNRIDTYDLGDRATHLLDVMRTEIWPLLPNGTPATNNEDQILGYNPETGV